MRIKNLFVVAFCALNLLYCVPALNAQIVFTVNSTRDVDDQNANNQQVTLREAIRRANETEVSDTIRFSDNLGDSPVIEMTGDEYVISNPLVIDARSLTNNLTINANGNSRILNIFKRTGGRISVEIFAVDFTGGSVTGNGRTGFGGAILNREILLLRRCSVLSSSASGLGGGLYNTGILTSIRNVFRSNQAGNGGGICNAEDAVCTIDRCTLSGNNVVFDGGGLLNIGNATLTSNTFESNEAGGGGGVANDVRGILTSDRCSFIRNSAQFGGAVDNAGAITLTRARIRLNSSTEGGGGVSNYRSGQISISQSTLDRNSCDLHGGAASNSADGTLSITTSVVTNNTATTGGGLDNLGDTRIEACTFGENVADQGGAIQTFGPIGINGSTFVANSAADYGGAISVESGGDLVLRNCTISANTAINFGGGVDSSGRVNINSGTLTGNAAGEGSGFFAIERSFRINNSIVNNDAAGTFSGSFNLFSATNASVDARGSNNLFGTNPRLRALADNGGPTLTHALRQDSPAIDRGSNLANLATDQRGLSRVSGGRIDIGAFESR